jgi:nitrate reductase beta subunit
VGRIRYLGVLLYDADQIEATAKLSDAELVDAHRKMILDPFDPEVIKAAKANGIHDTVIESAQASPVFKFVKRWGIALPLHIEFRTLPMLFYVPPLLPILGNGQGDTYDATSENLFGALDKARLPIEYLASLFSAGNVGKVRYALRKMMAVRYVRRQATVGDVPAAMVEALLAEADCTREQAEAIYRLTSLPTFDERFVIPPAHREEAIAALTDPLEFKGATGVGFRVKPERGS